MKLPDFNPEGKCPKCGSEEVNVIYHQSTDRRSLTECDCEEGIEQEHLGRYCEQCHYSWAEACLPNLQGQDSTLTFRIDQLAG